jgi:diaminopimelate epimerase
VSDVGPRFLKGHGTGNDFVLMPDPTGSLDLDPALVVALCDRRSGVGADGVLRVVPSALTAEAAASADRATWFMDYRNADGSLAEMCGNGLRVFARFLVREGLEAPGRFAVATRAGVRAVLDDGRGDVVVDMGPAVLPDLGTVSVSVDGSSTTWAATAVDMGNPHVVVVLDDLDDAGPLCAAPHVAPAAAFPDGVNVEFAVRVGPRHVAMRVHERGVGETQSCGTGACAVFAAVSEADGGAPAGDEWVVDVPGGRLLLRRRDDGGIDLRGPAELVADGTLDPVWVAAHGRRAGAGS